MKRASSEGRINAVLAAKITIEIPLSSPDGNTTPSISTHLALLHDPGKESGPPVMMGRETLVTTWPDNVKKLATELRDAIENHLLNVYFTNEGKAQDGDRGDYPIDIPKGLGGSGLGPSEDEPEQL